MTREEVLSRIRDHLAEELEVDALGDHRRHPFQGGPRGRLARPRGAHRRARGPLRHPHPRRGGGADPHGRAGRRLRRRPCQRLRRLRPARALRTCWTSCRTTLRARRSPTPRGSTTATESYERLAFLGDVVLSLAVSDHLFPRFERYGAGRLTKVRAQAVSGASCAAGGAWSSACPSGCARRRRTARGRSFAMLADSERVLASVCEAVIGAAYLAFGIERTAPGGGRRVRGRDRGGAGEPGGLQVAAAGAARPAGRGGGLPDRLRGGAGARAQLRGGRRGRRQRDRPRRGPDQEGRRAEGRARRRSRGWTS